MFGQLPPGLDRNFIFGHFLPAVVLLGLGLGLLVMAGAVPGDATADLFTDHFLATTAVAALVALLLAATFSALNEGILSLMKADFVQSGGGVPERLGRLVARICRFDTLQTRRVADYKRLLAKWRRLDEKYGPQPTEEQKAQIRRVALEVARDYPSKKRWILPTRFGNVVRAFTVYTDNVYGLDPSVGWPRLQTVMAIESRHLVEATKANVDLMVNLVVVWSLSVVASLVLLLWSAIDGQTQLWLIVTAAFSAVMLPILTWLAKGAAQRWGDAVTAAFDTNLPDLRKRLDLEKPESTEAERMMWSRLSTVWVYRRSHPPTGEGIPE